jgi:hypothetical protein
MMTESVMKVRVRVSAILCVALLTLSTRAAFAVDGIVLIDQNRALAGNVTPGDAPGFPVTITQPGSYRLSGNLSAGAADGIVVAADDVTLDLNGFNLRGSGASNQSGITESSATWRRAIAPAASPRSRQRW